MKIPSKKRIPKPWYLRDSISFFTGGKFKRTIVTGEAVLAPELFEQDEVPEVIVAPKRRKTRTEAILPAAMFDQTARLPDDGLTAVARDEAMEKRTK